MVKKYDINNNCAQGLCNEINDSIHITILFTLTSKHFFYINMLS